MPAENITITANWTPNPDTQYLVYHKQEDLSGNFVTVEIYT